MAGGNDFRSWHPKPCDIMHMPKTFANTIEGLRCSREKQPLGGSNASYLSERAGPCPFGFVYDLSKPLLKQFRQHTSDDRMRSILLEDQQWAISACMCNQKQPFHSLPKSLLTSCGFPRTPHTLQMGAIQEEAWGEGHLPFLS
jgi:hypothetical protein